MSWKQWIALFIAFGLYLLLGGVVIMIIESPAEESRLEELNELQRYVYDELITCRVNDTFERREQTWIQISQLINQPILVRNSSIPDNKWSIYNSFFVAVTAVTTIGYGHLSPSTASGKLFCIFFSLLGIPLNGILFVTLGDYCGTKLIERSEKRSGKKHRLVGYMAVLMYLLFYFIPGTLFFLALPAGLFTLMEGWSYFDSFYYAFISLTTIGFGDLVAGHQSADSYGQWVGLYRAMIVLWIFFGLAYLVMVISIITKGMTSSPVVALEKKMSASIKRAAHSSLVKDGLLLRQLVNQIRLNKVKPVYKSHEIHRIGSHPSVCFEDDCLEHPRRQERPKGFSSDTALGCIDVEATFHAEQNDGTNPVADPVELLSRLADALCDDEAFNEIDEEEEPTTINTEEKVKPSRASKRFKRAIRRMSRSLVEEWPSPPTSQQLGDLSALHDEVNSRRSFSRQQNRFRRLSESNSHYPFNYCTYRNSMQCQVMFAGTRNDELKMSGRSRRVRSVSESRSSSISPHVRFDWPESVANPTVEEEESPQPATVMVTEFCDLLGQVQLPPRQNGVTVTTA